MQINSISNYNTQSPNFGKLYNGKTIQKKIIEKQDTKLLAELERLTKALKERNLDVSENVDIILQYNKREGFYGLISLKDRGIPYNNPAYKKKIVNMDKPAYLMNFEDWYRTWEYVYSSGV